MNALTSLVQHIRTTYPSLAGPIDTLNPLIGRDNFLLEVMRVTNYRIPKKFIPSSWSWRGNPSNAQLLSVANADFIDDFKTYLDLRSKGLLPEPEPAPVPSFSPTTKSPLLRKPTSPPKPSPINTEPKLGTFLALPNDPPSMREFLQKLNEERTVDSFGRMIPTAQVLIQISEISPEALEEFDNLSLLAMGPSRFVLPNGCSLEFIGEAAKTLAEVIGEIDIRRKIKAKKEAEFKAKKNSFTGDRAPEDWGTW